MNKSESINELAAALARAQTGFATIGFNKINPHFKRGYADLTAIINATRPALAANGLAIAQFPAAEGNVVTVETVLTHSSGQWIGGMTSLTASKADAQGIGAAITYAKRYGLAAILNVAADEDDDGNAASEPPPSQRAAPKQDPKPVAESPAAAFARIVCEWSGVAPEDRKAACMDAAKRCGVVWKKDITEDEARRMLAIVTEARGRGQDYAEFLAETK